jgi:hypothetical protein
LRVRCIAALARPDVRDCLQAQGLALAGGGAQELAELTARDLERWAEAVRCAGIRAE